MLPRSFRLAAAGLALAACSKAPKSSAPPDGAALFVGQNCSVCHGPDGAGTKLGPTLRGKQPFWTREKLATYLRDPQALIRADERLKTQAEQYSLPMVSFVTLTLEERLALADHVLALP